ncbi:30S ribosomal protein S4 [Immundisolibacter sp.]|uniref:30S ribosomal protein S4 n=1 Tax=Immundisolibacter sp. TaxID=1934948 RepID=UPI000EC33A7E|nr:30S ribosomal protein S4 [Gammaproteobacteria bacterium]
MARYTGPRLRVVRRFQQQLPGLTRKTDGVRSNPPGQHGARRGRASDYRLRLDEKQKLIYNYGIGERQLRNYFKAAASRKGDTGKNLLTLLESRLDNVVFRLGFAPTIPAARQVVKHGHVTVNGRRVDIPSYQLRPGDVIGISEGSRKHPVIVETLQSPSLSLPEYLDLNASEMTGTFRHQPERTDVPLEVAENFVVEYYSRVS